jgi:hypothetical protein
MIELTDEFRERLRTATMDGFPVVLASVDDDAVPHLSFYGTTQVFDRDHLALWARDPTGLATRILTNPRVALVYRNSPERVTWLFDGIARREDDPAVRDQVFEASPEFERDQDPERNGIAIVIELTRVRGRGFLWERDSDA